ncbi:hypothetical protein [Paenibacillus sp. B1-33]|uniref:hypothetical protein n=1 Tax=unclassified Paenibacillus TaxID=185978 RepID=UPI003D2BB1D3
MIFSGSDPILTIEKLKKLITDKEVKYFLIPSSRGFGGPDGRSNGVIEWIRENGKEITNTEWSNSL